MLAAFMAVSLSALAGTAVELPLHWRIEALDAAGDRLGILVHDGDHPAVDVPTLLLLDRDTVIVRWTATDDDGRALPPTDAHYTRVDGAWSLTGILRNGE